MPRAVVALSCLACLAACHHTSTSGGCTNNASCDAGSVCVGGHCARLCMSDSDCSGTNAVCQSGACGTCTGCRAVPDVTSVDGDGSVDNDPSHSAHHLQGTLVLHGTHLAGVSVQLAGGNFNNQPLDICGTPTDDAVTVALPNTIAAGSYTLNVVNSAGACTVSTTLLQGETGPAGQYTIGAGLVLSGDTLSVDFGPGANQVAAGNHTHPDLLPKSGGTISGDLTVDGGTAVTVPSGQFIVTGTGAGLANLTLSAGMLTNSGMVLASNAGAIVDGDTTAAAWNTDSAAAGAWLQIDRGAGQSADYVEARVFALTAGYAGVYDIGYSDDGTSWSAADSAFTPSLQGWNEARWPSVGAHRYWRLRLTNNPGAGPALSELEMDATAAGAAIFTDAQGHVGIHTASPRAALDVNGGLRLGDTTIARVTTCRFTGTANVSASSSSSFYHLWQPADCDHGVPAGTCTGFLKTGVHSGSDEDWRVRVPGESFDTTGSAEPHGGMEWWCTTCNAAGPLEVSAVYMCDR